MCFSFFILKTVYCVYSLELPQEISTTGKIRKGNNCIVTCERILFLALCSSSHCTLSICRVSFDFKKKKRTRSRSSAVFKPRNDFLSGAN